MTNPIDPTDTAGHASGEELSALVDGELADEEAAAVRTHLETCEVCRAQRDVLREVRGLLAALDEGWSGDGGDEARAAAVASAMRALSPDESLAVEAAAGPAADLSDAGAAGVALLTRRRRRVRVLGLAAGLLLVTAVVGGVRFVQEHPSATASSAASTTAARQKAIVGGAGVPHSIAPSLGMPTVELRVVPAGGRLGTEIATLRRGVVSSVQLEVAPGGSRNAEISLARNESAVAKLESHRGSLIAAVYDGERLGRVHVTGARNLEVTGLSAAQGWQIVRLLT